MALRLRKMNALRARKQNRTWPEGAEEDNTRSGSRGSPVDHRLPAGAHPGAVLPTIPDRVQGEAYQRTGPGGRERGSGMEVGDLDSDD
jgi:hypothetical protein